MSSRKQVVSAAAVGLILAVSMIAAAAYFTSANLSSTSTSGTGATTGAEGPGTLDVLLTDPPNVPAGVTAVYITYSNVAVHVSGAGNQSGWTESNTTGTIDLMQAVNVSTTIAAIKVSAGVYNALRFNISSALVTFGGANYTAFVPKALLTVPIPGGIEVNSTSSSAEVIDTSPTVVNIGSGSTLEFIISVAASCFQVPPSQVTSSWSRAGFTFAIANAAWWLRIEQGASNLTITSASISADGLSLTVGDTGSSSTNITAIVVTPESYSCSIQPVTSTTTTTTTADSGGPMVGAGDRMQVPLCLTGSAVFLVEGNGTLVSVKGLVRDITTLSLNPSSSVWSTFGHDGLTIAGGGTATLTYAGGTYFGFPALGLGTGVVSGDSYVVAVIGTDSVAQTTVVAS